MKKYSGNKGVNRPFVFREKWNFTRWNCVFTSLHCVSTPMKGGHTHNHVKNHELKLMHTKSEREWLRRFFKKKLWEKKK